MRTEYMLLNLLGLITGCHAVDDTRPSRVLDPRVLALRCEPPEAAPGEPIQLSVLTADGGGNLTDSEPRLSFCRTPKLLGDNRFASDACALEAESPAIGPIVTVPGDACARFGPNVPAGVRPPDPDATGGYYQPIRIALEDLSAVGALRLRCPLTDAPFMTTRAYRERYVPNQTPMLTALTIAHDGSELDLGAVPRDLELELHSGWSKRSRERYVVYDRAVDALREQSEILKLSWFVSAGELSEDHTTTQRATNRLRSPPEPGPIYLWLVLRDDRGAQQYATYVLDVR